jgi:hypothetical protein
MVMLDTSPLILKLTSGDLETPQVIKRIEPYTGFCTLGVQVTPNGNCDAAMDLLIELALGYAKAVSISHLSRDTALVSYIQHSFPKLHYQMPALALTKGQCQHLTSIILMALLPKLHVNRNTSRNIVHGPVTLGGMAIPDLYASQGIDKVHLFLRHLRLGDTVGDVLAIALSQTQLIAGAKQFILNKDSRSYSWIDHGWLRTLWSFLNDADLKIAYQHRWFPQRSRLGDIFLMDYFISGNLKTDALRALNRYRMYLQVVTLLDIILADGSYILPEVKIGAQVQYRHSSLNWPIQGKPRSLDWILWEQELQYLEEGGKLRKPLGNWLCMPHQKWTTFYDTKNKILFLQVGTEYKRLHPSESQARYTTQNAQKPRYDLASPSLMVSVFPGDVVSATLQPLRQAAVYTVNAATSQFLQGPTLDTLTSNLPSSPVFSTRNLEIPWDSILSAASKQTLTIITDGSFNPTSGPASYSWIFRSTQTLCQSTGMRQSPSNPYHAELSGILAH